MLSTFRSTLRSFGWNTRLVRWTVASLLLCGALNATAQDTTPELEPIYTYNFKGWEVPGDPYDTEFAYSYHWMPNNTLFIDDAIQNPDSGPATQLSVLYDPYAPRGDAASLLSVPPLPARTLPPTHTYLLPQSFQDVFATSPDGRFDLYRVAHTIKSDGYYYPTSILGIVNRDTGKFMVLPEIHPAYAYGVTWSDNNESVILTFIGSYGGGPFYGYVTNFAEDVAQARGTMLTGWGEIADTLQWSIYQFYDMDSTGRYVLADGYLYNATSEQGSMRLLLIDMTDLSYEIIARNNYFSAAGFEQSGEEHILYVSGDGVFAYDRQEKTRTLLTDEIDASEILRDYYREFFPAFSPDGHYLATQLKNEDWARTLYVYPIPPIPEGK